MTSKHAASLAALQRASLVSVGLRNGGYVAIRCSTEVLDRMRAGQGAIVAAGANDCDSVFPGQNLQAAPVPFSQGCSQFTTSPSSLTGKPSGPHSLGPFVVELFSGRSFESVPAGVTRRIDQLPSRYLPTPATLCELVAKPAPRRRDYAATSTRPIAVGRLSWPHPLCTDTAFFQRLLSRRSFRVAQIQRAWRQKTGDRRIEPSNA